LSESSPPRKTSTLKFPITPLSRKNSDILAESFLAMKRPEFLQRLILNTICDDFENIDQMILREVRDQGAKCGLTIQRSAVVAALHALVEGGMAKSYELSASSEDPFSGELPEMPPLDVFEEYFRTYFYITKKGMEFHEADGTRWPFDDEGSLRIVWESPEA
jgi:hypothetical protein